jgi:sugar/nucleoside kinase (ribokinase family)
MTTSLRQLLPTSLDQLARAPLRGAGAVVGFDGFVDEMAGIVKERGAGGAVELVPTIAEFGGMVSAAAGRSFGRELAVKRVEAGGNAPNLADGLGALGLQVDFFGTLGDPIDPVFSEFAARCRSCTTLGACGRTLALEFGDGKLMLNNTGRLGELTAAKIERLIGAGGFTRLCRDAALIGFANWSRYPHMTDCWRVIAARVLPELTTRPWLIIDLADPSGRDAADLARMMDVVASMARACRVVFGANLNEAGVLLESIGGHRPPDAHEPMADAAEQLRRRLGAHMVAVHSQRRAAAAWEDAHAGDAWRAGRLAIDGAYNPAPVRTTGVGDRFNAGVAGGLVAGLPPAAALALGCAAGAWFVTVGRPLSLEDLPALADRLPR